MKRGLLIVVIILFVVKSAMWLSEPMVGPFNGMGDAQVRVMLVKGRNFIPRSGTWMPLPFKLIQFSLNIYDRVDLSPRLLWVIFSGCLAITLYFFASIVFTSDKVGLLSVLIFLLSPYFSAFLTFPLTEPLFALFFLWGFLSLERAPPWWRVLMAGIVFSLANAVRYEGWYLFPIILAYLVIRKKLSQNEIILFAVFYFLYPLWWLRSNYIETGDYLFFIREKLSYAHASGDYYWFNLKESLRWITIFFQHLGLVNCVVCFIGWKYLRDSNDQLWYKKYFVSLSIFLIVMLIIQTYVGSMEWFPDQYLYMSLLILLPIWGRGMEMGLLWLNRLNKKIAVFFILFLIGNSILLDYQWLYINQPGINTQLVENIKKTGDKQILVLFPGDMASDLDYIMYFAGHNLYTGTNIDDNILCEQLLSNEWSAFLSYDTSREFIGKVGDCCEDCNVVYEDKDHLLISK